MTARSELSTRQAVLPELGVASPLLEHLLTYGANHFPGDHLPPPPVLPLPAEPHLADWRQYADESQGQVLEYLHERLPQLAAVAGTAKAMD